MSKFYICKAPDSTHACLKVINDHGVELSLAFDDSCGALPELSRVSMATFHPGQAVDRSEVFHVTAEDFLESLARHLGYSVTK